MHSAMGVSIRYRKSAGGWLVRITHNKQRREQGGFGHGPEGKVRAEKYADEIRRASEAADEWSNPFPGKPCPIDQLCEGWRNFYGSLRSERTRITDEGRVKRLVDFFGNRDARTLTHADLVGFASHTMQNRSPSLAIGCLSTLRRVLNLAVRDGHLERNPAPTVAEVIKACRDRGSDEEGTRDAWTHQEAEELLTLAWKHEPHFAPALQFALATGARRGEILALRWEQVDFLRERVEIRRTVNPKGRDTKKVKTSERRFTPLESSLFAMLMNLHRRELRGILSDWVFPSPTGLLWHERNFERAWYRLRRRAKKAGVRPLPFHCTRHTFVTWALESGTPVKRVSEWVGASVSVIERTYAHVMPQIAPDLSFADMGMKWGGMGMITPSGDTDKESEVSDYEKEMNGDPGAIRTRDPQLRRLFGNRTGARERSQLALGSGSLDDGS